jgi:hypothetical protein
VPAAIDDLVATLTERIQGLDPPVKIHDGLASPHVSCNPDDRLHRNAESSDRNEES